MLKTSVTDFSFWDKGMLFIAATNIIGLVYALLSPHGLADLLSVYLIESALIGLFVLITLIRKLVLTRQILGGLGAISLFSLAYFSWLSFFVSLPILLTDQTLFDPLSTLLIHNAVAPELVLQHFAAALGTFIHLISTFIITYHWPALIAVAIVYGFEHLYERPDRKALRSERYSRFILRPFLRLMFVIYGPFLLFFAFYTAHLQTGGGQLSYTSNVIGVLIISLCKFALQTNSHRRHLRKQQNLLTKPTTRSLRTPLKETFTY